MKKISSLFCLFILSGCASKTLYLTPSPIDGSKADGTIVMGYVVNHEPMTEINTNVNWSKGLERAIKKCRVWGYSSAEKFGDFTSSTCQQQKIDYMWTGQPYCAKELVSITYQCHR